MYECLNYRRFVYRTCCAKVCCRLLVCLVMLSQHHWRQVSLHKSDLATGLASLTCATYECLNCRRIVHRICFGVRCDAGRSRETFWDSTKDSVPSKDSLFVGYFLFHMMFFIESTQQSKFISAESSKQIFEPRKIERI